MNASRTLPRSSSAVDPAAESPDWHRVVVILLLVIGVIFIFGSLLQADFVSVDDEMNVYKNPQIVGAHIETLAWFWTHSHQELYMPVVYDVWALLSMLSQALYGPGVINPHLFHAANLLCHAASACIVFFILDLLLKRRHAWAAGLGAAVFAFHPMQVEPVGWVTGLKDVLSGTLSFLALWLYLLFATRRENRLSTFCLAAGAFLSYIAALLVKPAVVTLPLMAALIDWLMLGRPWKKIARDLGPSLIPLAAALFLTSPSQLARSLQVNVPPLWRPLVAIDALGFYLWKFFVPFPLQFDYGRSTYAVLSRGSMPTGFQIFFALLCLGLLIAILLNRPPSRVYVCALGVVIIALLPVLGLMQFNFQNISTVADRYAYRALFGGSLAVAWLLVTQQARFRFLVPLVCLILVEWSGLSFLQTAVWRNTETLFRHCLKNNPASDIAACDLAEYYWPRRRYREMEQIYKANLTHEPHFSDSEAKLALLLMKTGRNDEALDYFRLAEKLDPQDPWVKYNYAASLLIANRVPEAAQRVQDALKADPNSAGAHAVNGLVLEKQGHLDEALAEEQKAIDLSPGYEDAYYYLGRMLFTAGQTQKGAHVLTEATQKLPGSLVVVNAYARLLATAPDPALRNGPVALKLARGVCAVLPASDPDPGFIDTLADACAENGDFGAALEFNRRAEAAARMFNRDKLAREIEDRGRLFRAGKPYHSPNAAAILPAEL